MLISCTRHSEKYAVVVGIDFGTSASSFAYAYKIGSSKPEIVTHDKWPDQPGGGVFKTDTALLYDTQTWSIAAWGASAMVCKPEKKKRKNQKNNNDVVCGDGGSVIAPKKGGLWGPNSTLLIGDSNNININSPKTISATMFKLHLADLKQEDKPHLPMNIDYRKYVDFYRNVLIVLTVPATYSERSKAILRECVWRVGLIESINAKNLEFTTEPEAAAIDCIPLLKQYGLKSGSAVQYGLDMRTVTTRVLRYTYGVQVLDKWNKNDESWNNLKIQGGMGYLKGLNPIFIISNTTLNPFNLSVKINPAAIA
nr:3314_t:CDS:2 [Entrophospora candida]